MKVAGLLSLLVALLLLLVMWLPASAKAESPDIGPYLQNPAPDAMTIMWVTKDACVGTVDYGLTRKLDKTAGEEKATKIHELRIEGLETFTKYDYRIRWNDKSDGPYTFRTARPPGAKKFRIAMYGDSRTNPEVHGRCVDVIAKHEPELVLNSGDLVSNGGHYAQWKPQFFKPLSKLIRNVPVITVLGNHERNSPNYYNLFALPGNEAWFSMDYGNLHLIGLDSNRLVERDSEQVQWLIEDLKKTNDEKWILVFFHHPMFSGHPTRGINGNRWWWQPIFQEYGVDLAVAGHDHHYVRCYPIGELKDGGRRTVQHFTSGGGGAGLYPIHDWPWIAKAVRLHNVTIVDFDGDQLKLRAYSEHGNLIDETVIVKDAQIPVDRFVSYDAVRWEEAFKKQLAALKPIEVTEGKIVREVKWQLPATFSTEIKIRADWQVADNWKFTTNKTEFVLKKGEGATISAKMEGEWPNCYPTPAVKLIMTGTDGKKLFRNNELDLKPVRLWPKRIVTAVRPPGPITIDAEPADWQGVAEVTSFVDGSGTKLAADQTRVRIARDKDNLYVFAYVDMADAEQYGKGDEDRDDEDILEEDEAFQVQLASDFRVYTFSVNTLNVQFDASRSNRKWDHEWQSAVAKAAATWYVEIKIPMAELGDDITRINFGHTDGKTETRSEWVPTFGRPFSQKYFGFLK